MVSRSPARPPSTVAPRALDRVARQLFQTACAPRARVIVGSVQCLPSAYGRCPMSTICGGPHDGAAPIRRVGSQRRSTSPRHAAPHEPLARRDRHVLCPLPTGCQRDRYERTRRPAAPDVPPARAARRALDVCEGVRPELLLFAAGLVDELWLTLNPKVAGGAAALTIVAGKELVDPAELEPVSVAEGDGDLFTRWRVRR